MAKKDPMDYTGHSRYSLYYNILFGVLYRRPALATDAIRERLKEVVYRLAPGLQIDVVTIGVGVDHVHILMCGSPTTDLLNVCKVLKFATSRHLRAEFPEIRAMLGEGGSLWADSKMIATAGRVGITEMMDYITSLETRGGKYLRDTAVPAAKDAPIGSPP